MSQPEPVPAVTRHYAARLDSQDPWERFGWVMGAIWLVFLGFPFHAALTADTALVWRGLAAAGIVAFAGVYVAGFIRLGRCEDWSVVNRIGWTHLGIMVALTLAVSTVIGLEAMGTLPFMVALAMFSLPLAAALGVGVGALAVALILPWSLGVLDETWFFMLIVLLVGVSTGVVRVLEQRQSEHRMHESELALVAERERVARDVHDVLGHSLTVVSVKAQLAERLLDSDPERARAELAQIQSLTREALAEIRATVAGLRVARLGDELQAARAALAAAGIEAELATDVAVVDPRHRIVAAWVLREAVTNVVRHSAARQCAVDLEEGTLRVTDDGRGPDGLIEGNGLRGVRERVAAAGGTLTIGPGPDGRGTTVEVRL